MIETAGAAEAAHHWPAQKLLDYGEAVLGSLRPGMIWAAMTPVVSSPRCSTKPATASATSRSPKTRWPTVPTSIISDFFTRTGSQRSQDDSQHAFQDYLADAQKRLEHDQQFPDEAKRIRPGEEVRVTDGKVQVSGHAAVVAIRERLLRTLMDKNPDASFAIVQSFPLESMYSNTVPLGPIMGLRVADAQNVFTTERAAQSVDYWRTTAQQLLADPETPDGSDPRKAYSKLVSEQGALLLDHKYTAEAEQAFKIANDLCPSSAEVVFRYVALLVNPKRFADAVRVAESGLKAAPDNQQLRIVAEQLKKMRKG